MSGRSPRWFTGIKYPYEANFADNTWAQIIAACQRGTVPETWAVGNQKTMTIGGTDYTFDIIGKYHDDYADGSGKAPLTLQMHDCYATAYAMNTLAANNIGWHNCAMRTTHLPAILALMPTDVQAGICEVTKKTSVGGASSTIAPVSDKLFLLSEVEIFGAATYSAAGEGTQYDYYKAGNSKVKKRSGAAAYWWSRSPLIQNARRFCQCTSNGSVASADTSDARSVAFGLCF